MQIVSGHNADIGLINFEEFIESVKHFSFLPAIRYMQEASLIFENKIRLKEDLEDFKDPPRKDLFVFITRDAHAFVAKSVLLYAGVGGENTFTRNDYKWLIASYHELKTDLTYLDFEQEDAYKYTIRVQNLQFRYWNVYGDITGRFIVMFGLDKAKEINEMCEEVLGLSFLDCVTISICMLADMRTRRQLNFKMLVENTIDNERVKSCLTYEKLKIFCENFSITPADFGVLNERYRSQENALQLQTYEFNPLCSFPIIKIDEDLKNGGSLIIPSIPDLIYASCEGVYYKLMDKYKGPKKQNLFSGKFGSIFEAYVYHLLHLAELQFFDEKNLNENPHKLDVLLILDEIRVHAEIKKSKMSVLAKAGIGTELEKYIDRMAFENIYGQLYKKRDTTSINLLICMDELFFFEEKIKTIIEKKLSEKIDYDNQFRFHLLGIGDLEYLVDFLINTQTTLIEFLKVKEEKYYYMSVSNVIAKHFGYKPTNISFLQEKYLEFYCSLYSGKKNTA